MTFTTLVSVEAGPKPPHIALCVPAFDMCSKDSRNCLRDMRDYAKRNFLISDVDGSASDVVAVRNLLLVGGRDVEAEWYFFADSDNIYPPDTLHRLFAHNKPIVGATYVRRAGNHGALGQMVGDPDIENIWKREGLVSMLRMPFGCMLVKADVFNKLDKPHFRHIYDIQSAGNNIPGGMLSEDHAFCERVREVGYEVFCDVDLSKQVGHEGKKTYFWNDR